MGKSLINHFSTMTLGEIKKSIEAPVMRNVLSTLSGEVAACPSMIIIDSVELDPDVYSDFDDDDEEVRVSEDTIQVYGRVIFADDEIDEMQFTTWVEYFPEDDDFLSEGSRCLLFHEPSPQRLFLDKMRKEREEKSETK